MGISRNQLEHYVDGTDCFSGILISVLIKLSHSPQREKVVTRQPFYVDKPRGTELRSNCVP